jgi:hypothetical protein
LSRRNLNSYNLDRKLSNLADAMEATGGDPLPVGRMKDARRQRDEEVLPEPITAHPHTDAAGLTSWTLKGVSSFEAGRPKLRCGGQRRSDVAAGCATGTQQARVSGQCVVLPG